MKVLHISTLSQGGAFNSAYRLHKGLLEIGVESSVFTLSQSKYDDTIAFPSFGKYGLSIKNRALNKLGIRALNAAKRVNDYNKIDSRIEAFASPSSDYKLGKYIVDQIKPDIVNLHWCANFLDFQEFFGAVNLPIVWTLHDEQPFSAYWHYSNDRVATVVAREIEEEYFRIKADGLAKLKNQIQIIAPSQWLLDQSKESELFKNFPHKLIRYGLETNIYKMTDELPESFVIDQAKENKIKLLFICQSVANQRKGMNTLLEALSQLNPDKYQLIAVGEVSSEIQKDLTLDTVFTGSIGDPDELSRIYNFCDAMVIPSKQDNLPNTMLESLCCGTPVIGTPAGGISEILKDPVFGVLSNSHDAEDLSNAIRSFTVGKFERKEISKLAHKSFHLKKQAGEYLSIYESLFINKKV